MLFGEYFRFCFRKLDISQSAILVQCLESAEFVGNAHSLVPFAYTFYDTQNGIWLQAHIQSLIGLNIKGGWIGNL